MGSLPAESLFWSQTEDTEIVDDGIAVGEGGQLSGSAEQYVVMISRKPAEVHANWGAIG